MGFFDLFRRKHTAEPQKKIGEGAGENAASESDASTVATEVHSYYRGHAGASHRFIANDDGGVWITEDLETGSLLHAGEDAVAQSVTRATYRNDLVGPIRWQ